MKCYTIDNHCAISPGLPISYIKGEAFVRLGLRRYIDDSRVGQLRFGAGLLEPFKSGAFAPPSRILRCDAEARADVWLLPESKATANDALILCNGLLPIRKKGPRVAYDRQLAEVFLEADVLTKSGEWNGQIVLLRMKPGGHMTVFTGGAWRWSSPVPNTFVIGPNATPVEERIRRSKSRLPPK
jgi:hypothetical protein